MEYPFDEEKSVVDSQVFAVLAKYFPLVDDLDIQSDREFNMHRRGMYIFNWNHGWETLMSMPLEDLVSLSPFLFVRGEFAFENKDRKDNFDTDRLLALMKERGVTAKAYLDALGDFEFVKMGPESTQIIAAISHSLESISDSESRYASNYYNSFGIRFQETKERLKTLNKGKAAPFTLEKSLSFEDAPVCLRYADDGRLYVLDVKGTLHEFTSGEKTNQWELFIEYEFDSEFDMMPTLPSIAVAQEYAFIVGGHTIKRYDLSNRQRRAGKIYANIEQTIEIQGYCRALIHDIVLKEGNLLLSLSDPDKRGHSIVQGLPQEGSIDFREIYRGPFPSGFMHSSLAEYTLRMDVHCGHLFFPRKTGISLYQGDGQRGQKPKELLSEELLTPGHEDRGYGVTSPITKFAFGDSFMVAQAFFNGFEIPMLAIFRPVYAQEPGLVSGIMAVPPDRLVLEYMGYAPKMTGKTLIDTSIGAHGTEFATTHSILHKVYIHRMNEGN